MIVTRYIQSAKKKSPNQEYSTWKKLLFRIEGEMEFSKQVKVKGIHYSE